MLNNSKKKSFAIITLGLFCLFSCPNPLDENDYEPGFISFSFLSNNNPLDYDIEGTINNFSITVILPYETDARSLVASFDAAGGSVWVDDIKQTSGITVNDFTNPLKYSIKAENGNIKEYTLTIELKWHGIATIDSSINDVGKFSSIAVEGDCIYISYYDDTDNDLMFARSMDGGTTWDIDTLDSEGDAGKHSSIALAVNNVYISYYESSGRMKFIRSADNGSTWDNPVIIDNTVATVDNFGRRTSIAAEGDNVYISYYDNRGADLKLAKSINNGINWCFYTMADQGIVGLFSSIAVDNGNIFVCFTDITALDTLCIFKSSNCAESWWNSYTIEIDSGNLYWYPSIYTRNDYVYVCYLDDISDDLILEVSNGGTNWNSNKITIDSEDRVGKYSSIAVEGEKIYISYYDETNDNLKFASSTTENMENLYCDTIDSDKEVGSYTSIASEGDFVYISYYDITNSNLKFAKSLNNGTIW